MTTFTPLGPSVNRELPAESPSEPGRRVRLRVLVHRFALDRELADGVDPATRPELAARAAQLVQPKTRRRYAGALRDLVDAVQERPAFSAAVPIDRREVLASREALLSLAEDLYAPGPVEAQGVAMAIALLRDGSGPLFYPSEPDSAWKAARAASTVLRRDRWKRV